MVGKNQPTNTKINFTTRIEIYECTEYKLEMFKTELESLLALLHGGEVVNRAVNQTVRQSIYAMKVNMEHKYTHETELR